MFPLFLFLLFFPICIGKGTYQKLYLHTILFPNGFFCDFYQAEQYTATICVLGLQGAPGQNALRLSKQAGRNPTIKVTY